MKKALLSLAAIASVTAAVPAIAQAQAKFPMWFGGDTGYASTSIDQREKRIAWQIQRGERNRDLSRREAQVLRMELMRIERLEARYAWGGFNRAEYIDLSQRLNRLEGQVSVAMNDYDRGNRYGSGYGYGYGDR